MTFRTSNVVMESPKPPSLGMKIIVLLLFAVIFALGAGFLFLMGKATARFVQVSRWPTVPCVVESNRIINRSNDYQFLIG